MEVIKRMSDASLEFIHQHTTDEDYRLRMASFITQMSHNELIYFAILMTHEGMKH